MESTMGAFFELLDLKSGNLAGDYDRAEDALAALRDTAHRHGRSTIARFSLLRIDGDDQHLVAMNDDLVRLVEEFSELPDILTSISAGPRIR